MNFTKEDLLEIEIVRLEKVLEKAYEILSNRDVTGTGYITLLDYDNETSKNLQRFVDFKRKNE